MAKYGHFGSFWPYMAIWAHRGHVYAGSHVYLRPPRAIYGHIDPNMAIFRSFWVILGHLGPGRAQIDVGACIDMAPMGPYGHIWPKWPNMAILTHFGVILGHFRPILGHFGGPRPGMAKKGHFRSFWLFGVPGGHGEGLIR